MRASITRLSYRGMRATGGERSIAFARAKTDVMRKSVQKLARQLLGGSPLRRMFVFSYGRLLCASISFYIATPRARTKPPAPRVCVTWPDWPLWSSLQSTVSMSSIVGNVFQQYWCQAVLYASEVEADERTQMAPAVSNALRDRAYYTCLHIAHTPPHHDKWTMYQVGPDATALCVLNP